MAGMLKVAGLNRHEMSGVLGWHPKFTLPVKPLTDAIVTLKFADSPAFTVALPELEIRRNPRLAR